MPSSEKLVGNGITVTELLGQLNELQLESFREKFGDIFLIHTGRASNLVPPDRPWRATFHGKELEKDGEGGLLNKDSLIYPVQHTERTLTPRFVSIGRNADTNDIIINDRSVSGAHAVVEKSSRGGYVVRDLGSSNGTFVNHRSVPKHKTSAMIFGDTIRLGSIILTFVDAKLLALLAKHVIP